MNHNLAVTWDSSQSNSYFYHPLETTLGKADAFTVDFDIQLNSLHWTNTFQLAVGLLNISDAVDPGFSRALGYSPNIFEFNYFPDSGDGFGDPDVAASMTDDTDSITSFPNFYFIYDTRPMIPRHELPCDADARGGRGIDQRDGFHERASLYHDAVVLFRAHRRIPSRYDFHQQLQRGGPGSRLRRVPARARHGGQFRRHAARAGAQLYAGGFTNGVWQTRFTTYTDTHYTLQRSTNFMSWSDVTASVAGNGDILFLSDTNAVADKAFYRVRADKP